MNKNLITNKLSSWVLSLLFPIVFLLFVSVWFVGFIS